MSNITISVIENKAGRLLYGVSGESNDRTQAKDIPALAKTYYETVGKHSGEVMPFFVVSKDYDTISRDFQLFIGGLIESEGLQTFMIPPGTYGKATVKPKFGFLWSVSIGETKRAFYTKWLPKSNYTALHMEYEYHTESSKGKHPHIELLFAIRERTAHD